MKQAFKYFFNNPIRIVALIALAFVILAILTGCGGGTHEPDAPSPVSRSKVGPTAALYTVEHDDHMFVVYSTKVFQGGLVHHPDCLERDLR